MATILHKDLTGTDLHIPKTHASSHEVGGSDFITELGYFTKGTSFPTSPSVGNIFFKTDEDKIYVYLST